MRAPILGSARSHSVEVQTQGKPGEQTAAILMERRLWRHLGCYRQFLRLPLIKNKYKNGGTKATGR